MFTNDGKPLEGTLESLETGRYRWLVAEHELIIKIEGNQTLIELVLLPGDDSLLQLFKP